MEFIVFGFEFFVKWCVVFLLYGCLVDLIELGMVIYSVDFIVGLYGIVWFLDGVVRFDKI